MSVSNQVQLLYKVRGQGSPRGKPRIYFTCCPEGASYCLGSISSDLLKAMNCVVWYKKNPAIRFHNYEEMHDLLGQMQLFVLPITTRLLTVSNPVMDQEYDFALQHHIPVQPLMMEDNIDDLFSRRFGSVQYLSPHRNDPASISYRDKLSRYLKSTLAGDDLAQEVRKVFDSYIFLSYRKKDRREALRLMRLIHQQEFCERIAIWYDEYLVPTEDFNAGIPLLKL